ncbi:MAG: polyamine aminopropyltransferase [Desulfobacterales bacterium]|nr:polyamine aminopropyltransferase [Desulfobacterales bacterium]
MNALDLWIKETHQDSVALSFKVENTLFSGKSPFQQVDIVKTRDHGAMLLNDGIIMVSERDEFVYHEMISHVPLSVHPAPSRVLVIGGGDGGTVREVVKHDSISRVVMVEIDEMVVNACREHMPSVSHALKDPRVELIIGDGVKYVATTDETFDVVLIDSTDPIGPAAPLFDRQFYQNVAGILTEDGIMISQAESPFYDFKIQSAMLANQRPFFNRLHLYTFTNLTYPGGLWSFGFGANALCPLTDFDPNRIRASGIQTRYYTPEIHASAFMLPKFVQENLSDMLDPLPSLDKAFIK